jgi:lipoate-protein ligase A
VTVRLLDLTLATPADNVSLDEALLEAAEQGQIAGEVLRVWEPAAPLVVVGRSSRVAEEIDLAACAAAGIPVLRRASGGAAIVAGPGCLMYAVVLPYAGRHHLRMLDELHRHVLGIVARAVGTLGLAAEHAGTSDLALWGRKFSGNSVRCKHDHLLYHGTLLYGFDLTLLDRLLRMPPRQPAYRAGRGHADFVTNLPVEGAALRAAVAAAFGAREPLLDWPQAATAELSRTRYQQAAWNFQR